MELKYKENPVWFLLDQGSAMSFNQENLKTRHTRRDFLYSGFYLDISFTLYVINNLCLMEGMKFMKYKKCISLKSKSFHLYLI